MKVSNFKYAVSYNCDYPVEVGDVDSNTIDFIGDDVEPLVEEVIDDDPHFPLKFVKVNNDEEIVGFFCNKHDEDEVVGVMAHTAAFMQ